MSKHADKHTGKTDTNAVAVVEDNTIDVDSDLAPENYTGKDVELIDFDVTLRNGNTVRLAALKNEEDWPYELLEHAQRGNHAVFLNGVLTWDSLMRLRLARATVPDFRTVSIAYGEATGKAVGE